MGQESTPPTDPPLTDWLTAYPTLRKVSIGLAIIYYGFAISLLASMALGVLGAALHDQHPTITHYFGLLIVAAMLLSDICGRFLFLDTPSEVGVTKLIYVCFVLTLIGQCSVLAKLLLNVTSPIFYLITWPINTIAFVLFLLYLRALARFLNSTRLASRARNVLIVGLIFPVLAWIGSLMLPKIVNNGNEPNFESLVPFLLLGFTCFVLGLYFLIKYLTLLQELRSTIRAPGATPG